MTRDDVQAWLDRYEAAWQSYDPAAIGDLFAEGVEYRYHPADEPVVGRDASLPELTPGYRHRAGDLARCRHNVVVMCLHG